MMIPAELIAFVAGFPVMLAHLAIALGAFVLAGAVYSLTSRAADIAQVRQGNAAASVLYGATLLALALPIARALSSSSGYIDIALWSLAAGLAQLALFGVCDLLLAGLTARIRDDADMAASALLGAARLATALLLSAAISV